MNLKLSARTAAPIAAGVDLDVKLVVKAPGRSPRLVRVGDDFLIGRDQSCHLRIDHDRVGLGHCRIRRAGGRVVAEDLNSIYGTLLNDRPIRRAEEVRDGDRLRVGPATLVLRIAEGEEDRGPSDSWLGIPLDGSAPRTVIEDDPDAAPDSPAAETARRLLAQLAVQHDQDEPPPGLEVASIRGIAVVRALAPSLASMGPVRRLAGELGDLIASGRALIALDLGAVEELSDRAVRTIAEARDRCRSAGGLLRLCDVRASVSQLLFPPGHPDPFEVAPDVRSAVEADWPGRPRSPAGSAVKAELRLRLICLVGRSRGKVIEVSGTEFLIGRDPACQLRPNSPDIAPRHTALGRRDGRAFVRDLGSREGTRRNTFLLLRAEAELFDGDRLEVGPLLFSVVLGDRDPSPDLDEPIDN